MFDTILGISYLLLLVLLCLLLYRQRHPTREVEKQQLAELKNDIFHNLHRSMQLLTAQLQDVDSAIHDALSAGTKNNRDQWHTTRRTFQGPGARIAPIARPSEKLS